MRFAELQARLSCREPRLVLHRHNIYIVPSGFGMLWLGGAAALYLIGINGRSNGPVLLSQLMLGLFLLSMVLSQLNLQGLQLSCLNPLPSCADEPALLPLVATSNRTRPGLVLRWLQDKQGRQQQAALRVDLRAGRTKLNVPWMPLRRGIQAPGRLLLSSQMPLGLFRCWSYWEPPVQLCIAPARQAGPVQTLPRHQDLHGHHSSHGDNGSDELSDLKPWRAEEGLQRLAWSTLARGQGAYSKRFATEQSVHQWLAPAAGVPLEAALEHLCERVCQGLGRGDSVGLVLPNGTEIPPEQGQPQLQRCLQALAAVPLCMPR